MVLYVLVQRGDGGSFIVPLHCCLDFGVLFVALFGFTGCHWKRPLAFYLAGGIGIGKHSSDIWKSVTLYLLLLLWRKQNRHTFEDIDCLGTQLLILFIRSLLNWSHAWGLSNSNSILEYIVATLLYIIHFLWNSLGHFVFIIIYMRQYFFNKILLLTSKSIK